MVSGGTSVRTCFGSPFSSKVVCGYCLATLSLTINETLKWLSSLPILMQKSFWWRQCSDRYIISLSPHLHTPFSPSLISLMVSMGWGGGGGGGRGGNRQTETDTHTHSLSHNLCLICLFSLSLTHTLSLSHTHTCLLTLGAKNGHCPPPPPNPPSPPPPQLFNNSHLP